MTLTKEWLLKTIAELEEERDAIPGAVNEDAAMALAAMKLALASMTAEPVGFIARHKETGDFGSWFHPKADWFKGDKYEILNAYTAPPAPVSAPAGYRLQPISEYDAMCAAMLQGAAGNSPAIPDGYALVPVEPTREMVRAALFKNTNNAVWKAMLVAAPKF